MPDTLFLGVLIELCTVNMHLLAQRATWPCSRFKESHPKSKVTWLRAAEVCFGALESR